MYLKTALWLLVAAAPLREAALSKNTLQSCLQQARVPVDATNSSVWNGDIQPFNARLPYTPMAVAVPTTIAQIQAAVSCAAKAGVKTTPKPGGHSYASLGLGGENGHLMVELDRMYNVTLNNKTNVATVQPGER